MSESNRQCGSQPDAKSQTQPKSPGWYVRDSMQMFDCEPVAYAIDASPTECVADVHGNDEKAESRAHLLSAATELFEALALALGFIKIELETAERSFLPEANDTELEIIANYRLVIRRGQEALAKAEGRSL